VLRAAAPVPAEEPQARPVAEPPAAAVEGAASPASLADVFEDADPERLPQAFSVGDPAVFSEALTVRQPPLSLREARSELLTAATRPAHRPVLALKEGRSDGLDAGGVPVSSRPAARPAEQPVRAAGATVRAPVAPRQSGGRQTKGPLGPVCNDPSIFGRELPDIPGKLAGCGVRNPVAVVQVDGVRLSRPTRMSCQTAAALKAWVRTGVKPAVGKMGGGVSSLVVAAGYICRSRNNRPGGKISEHGKGRAIDISAIQLQDGSRLSLLRDWRGAAKGRALKQMHKAACGPFTTVLGPSADQYHQDHFHLDTARRKSGAYCR
jgi:hypothetical protein